MSKNVNFKKCTEIKSALEFTLKSQTFKFYRFQLE